MSPRSRNNTVMQVNMGEGKSSVIIPICAAALADGNQLVRVIVPKSLIPQTLEVLTDRLSGLVNKPICHLTFSRNDAHVKIDKVTKPTVLHRLVSNLRNDCGIIVVQPEHVLSPKLACVEKMTVLKRGYSYVPRVLRTGSLLKLVSKGKMIMMPSH